MHYDLGTIFGTSLFVTFQVKNVTNKDVVRHGILHKPSASLKFWPKSFRKSSGIFDIFCIINYA